jgi:N-acyl-D-amino-acid deacylase
MHRWTVRTLSLWLLLVGLLTAAPAQDYKAAPAPDYNPERPPRTGPANADLASFDEMMERFVRENEVPGAALAVAKDGRLVYARGFGYADPTAKTPVQPRARFRIASISKPITAAAILRLVEMGKLRLDDCAFDLLDLHAPPDQTEDPRLRKITVRQLLARHGAAGRTRARYPLHDGPEARLRPGQPLRLLQFRLLRPGPDHREDRWKALCRIRRR